MTEQVPPPSNHTMPTLTGVVPAPPVLVAKEDCAVEGHDFEFVVNGAGELLRLLCSRCDSAWAVTPV